MIALHDKEAIRNRIIEAAIQMQYRSESMIPDEVQSTVDLLSKEFELLYEHVNRRNDYVIREVRRQMYPSLADRKIPRHKLFFKYPKDPEVSLNPHEDILEEKTTVDGKEKLIFFTPLVKNPLQKIYVKYKIWRSTQTTYDKEGKEVSQEKIMESEIPHGVLKIGMDLEMATEPKSPVNIYFDWGDKSDGEKETLNDKLHLLKFQGDDRLVSSRQGFYYIENTLDYDTKYLNQELIFLREMEQFILQKYTSSFVHLDFTRLESDRIHDSFNARKSQSQDNRDIEESIFWITVKFPHGYEAVDLGTLTLRTNLYPVCNRRLVKDGEIQVESLTEHCQILNDFGKHKDLNGALSKPRFLALDRVYSAEKKYEDQYSYRIGKPGVLHRADLDRISDPEELLPGYYRLQFGSETEYDLRDYIDRIRELKKILNKKNQVLYLLDDQKLRQMTESLQKCLSNFEVDMKKGTLRNLDIGYYLRVMPIREDEKILFWYWESQ